MLRLRKPSNLDLAAIKAAYQRSAALHSHWACPPDDYSVYLRERNRYFLCLSARDDIVGTFNISGVIRGRFQSAYLGYEVFYPYQRKGYMSQGMQLLLAEAFGPLNLHRLEANIQPDNAASIRLVKNAGFTKEGYSRAYLNVGGKGWKDHERWAIVNPHWRPEHQTELVNFELTQIA